MAGELIFKEAAHKLFEPGFWKNAAQWLQKAQAVLPRPLAPAARQL